MRRRRSPAAAAVTRRGRFVGPLLTALVLIVGLAATALVVVGLRTNQQENADRVMDQRTAVALAAVRTETERYRSLIEMMAAGLSVDDALTWEDFDVASAPLESASLIGAVTVAYVVPSPATGVPAAQRLWQSRGAEGLALRPVADAKEHFFTIFTRTLNDSGVTAAGVDLAASAEASTALTEARRTSQPTVSDTYVLLRDRNLPSAQQQQSFVFVAPIWTRAPIAEFRGWIVLGLRSQDFLGGVLRTVSQGQLDGELLATDREGDQATVAQIRVPGTPDLVRENDFRVADQQWTLITRADDARLPGARSSLPLIVLIGGCAIALILAGLMHILATGRARAWARVQEATVELRDAEAESRRQAGLLGAVMTSIGDGVGVVDGNGEFLLHNPAAKALLGVRDDIGEPGAWQEHYGLYRPDGRTPFPVDELPLIRALGGESCDGVEMIVRNAERPEGILVSVDGRPLDPSAGQHGAVAVFHDITDLRRYETDLAVFAGVVAHDLKAPLAVIRGHCEAAGEDLGDVPSGPALDSARSALVRIIHAVDRMAGLIDTLLAYTTARDAPLRLLDVDLGQLVAEVIEDRTAHLRADRPDFYVGPLPEVRADPAMLRHVLDNLVGNALKYVRPGKTARVDVTAEELPTGQVQVVFADRGIGIPDGDKPEIFETFHRASTAAGYAGTGLGLAICKRIVERHGGEIGVADNPGGGTRFHFTLPFKEVPMTRHDDPTVDEAATRAALDRALAERSAMENSRLPGLAALPAADPSSHEPSAARLRAPVPDHHPTGSAAG
ncbi:ATP-binding protein [Micromonosporaceae bacterium Da 78-11]